MCVCAFLNGAFCSHSKHARLGLVFHWLGRRLHEQRHLLGRRSSTPRLLRACHEQLGLGNEQHVNRKGRSSVATLSLVSPIWLGGFPSRNSWKHDQAQTALGCF